MSAAEAEPGKCPACHARALYYDRLSNRWRCTECPWADKR